MTLKNKRLFISGLPWGFTESQLLKLFVTYGRVVDVRIIKDHRGRSKGIGYVEFDLLESAQTAKKELHNYKIRDDRTIIVDFAKPDPLSTPEGQTKRIAAQKKKRLRKSKKHLKNHVRQSVFDSRTFGSKIGKKFASRTKRSKKK